MKKFNIKSLLFVSITILLLTGCVQWQNATGVQKINSQKITLDLKNEKWHALNNDSQELYILTKDGTMLQSILMRRVTLDKALNSSKKTISEDILLHELAELIIEDIKLANKMKSLQVLSNQPEKIDGHDAIEITFQLKDSNDNVIKFNSSYFIFDKKLYQVTYHAPRQYYYQKDLNKYLNIKKSIKLNL